MINLKHIVFVPDGNRRWAKERGKPAFFGHREGAKRFKTVADEAFKMEIPCITFWGCSVNNVVKREKKEVEFLFKLFLKHFNDLLKDKKIMEKGVRVNVIGRWEEFFPENLRQSIYKIVEKTKDNKKYNLNFLMAYSGVDEMVSAVKRIADKKMSQEFIDAATIKENLWTRDLPPVDLVVRTGGEPHWSAGLLMFDVAESQLYFTEVYWPAFDGKEFKKATEKYFSTERRIGK
jgi:undecaprenyl diphosphate synthase